LEEILPLDNKEVRRSLESIEFYDDAIDSWYRLLDIKILFANVMFQQVRELNLLRESNAELREENKKSFEDCKVGYYYAGIHCNIFQLCDLDFHVLDFMSHIIAMI
jgi:hypothetical protein